MTNNSAIAAANTRVDQRRMRPPRLTEVPALSLVVAQGHDVPEPLLDDARNPRAHVDPRPLEQLRGAGPLVAQGASRSLLKFGGGSVEILRDLGHWDTEPELSIAGTARVHDLTARK